MNTNIEFAKIAPFLTHPLVLAGFALFLLFSLFKVLIKAKIIPEVSKEAGAGIVHVILSHGFIITLTIVLLGFLLQGLQNLYAHRENQGTAIQKTLNERANAAFSAVFNELGSDVQTIGTLLTAIEDDTLLQPFEKYEKRRVNETELSFRERVKNHYRDYHSYIKSLIEKFPISDSTWKAHQNDLLTLGENDISKFRSAYEHIALALDYLQRYVESVQHTVSLNYSDTESYANITSQRAEKLASVKIELCTVVSTVVLLARNDEELLPFQLGLGTAGIKDVPIIRGVEGAKLLTQKSLDYHKDKVKVLTEASSKLNAATDKYISATINDPYIKMMRRTIGLSESLTEAEIYGRKNKKLDPEEKDISKLLSLAYTSYAEADGENAIIYFERAAKLKGLPDNMQKYLSASIHRLKNPDEFGESLGFMIMDIDKKGLFSKSGFHLDDILIGIDDKPLIEPTDISMALGRSPDHPFLIRLVREGQKMELAVKPGKSAGATITQLVAFGQVRL
ncbi:PDZ domain-containing protein [Methylomonas rhizoryzae]|uniref:hypothetical protein n=1 Tax=Methylomonas rhizoryzae TaxID=2608981 RepID=UPI0012327821|nr:hypothetical protein [Methylomonas rhizoryzae]